MKTYESVTTIRAARWDGTPASTLEVVGIWLYGPGVKMEHDDYPGYAVEAFEKLLLKSKVKVGYYIGVDSKGNTQWIPGEMFESVYTETGDVILS